MYIKYTCLCLLVHYMYYTVCAQLTLHMHLHTYICKCVCINVCMYVLMYACLYVCTYACMHVCVCVCVYAYSACVYMCAYTFVAYIRNVLTYMFSFGNFLDVSKELWIVRSVFPSMVCTYMHLL